MKQPIMMIGKMVGPGYQLGQAMKKLQESSRLTPEAAVKECLGAINYIAARVISLQEDNNVDARGREEGSKG